MEECTTIDRMVGERYTLFVSDLVVCMNSYALVVYMGKTRSVAYSFLTCNSLCCRYVCDDKFA